MPRKGNEVSGGDRKESGSAIVPVPEGRAARAAERIADRGLAAVLVTDPVNLRWLTGFLGGGGAAICGGEHRLLFVDFRYREIADRIQNGWQVEVISGDWIPELAAAIAGRAGIDPERLGFEDAALSAKAYRLLVRALVERGGGEAVDLQGVGGLVSELRRAKDDAEIRTIAEAAALSDQIYRTLLEHGLKGRTEREVARDAAALMVEWADGPSFQPMVASGPNGVLLQPIPSGRRIRRGDLVVIDLGVNLAGYTSDCTRTYAVDALPSEAAEAYAAVRAAHSVALGQVRAGAVGRDIDAAARTVVEEHGYGDRFMHALGHGVGLTIHERPRLSGFSPDVMQPGEVVTVEPGIYLPGRFGVRLEDLLVVGEDEPRILTHLPRELVAVD